MKEGLITDFVKYTELPRDRATLNAWCRSIYALYPVVNLSVEFHTSMLMNNIKVTYPKIGDRMKRIYQDIWKLIDLENALNEYWILGEVFLNMELAEDTENTATWQKMKILNPDYIHVKRSCVMGESIISLRPDENLRRICMSSRPSDIKQREALDPKIVEHVRLGENIPLSNFYTTMIQDKKSPYEIRGTSMLIPALDRIRKEGTDESVKELLCYPHGEHKHVCWDVFRNRLQRTGGQFSRWLEDKVFGPVAKMNDVESIPTVTFDVDKAIKLHAQGVA